MAVTLDLYWVNTIIVLYKSCDPEFQASLTRFIVADQAH
ncbi:hypothetical protein QE439_000961 [Pedobacter agri]|nr:hypothetical protein [Pedobacter agri]